VLKGFRDFILRGNVIELAVAVVIGAAFNNVVTQFSKSFIDPLIRLLSGGNSFGGTWWIKGGQGPDGKPVEGAIGFDYGAFVTTLLQFVITAAVVYFIFIYPMNKLNERRKRGEEPESDAPSDEVRLLTEIRDALVSNGTVGRPGDTPVAPPQQPPRR
jgi:large conductance mechanosensitive channel